MRAFRSVLLAIAYAAGSASTAVAQSPSPQQHQYWHVWVDSAGVTHQTQCEFKDFIPLSLGKGVEPIFIDKLRDMPAHVVIAQFPKGWVGQWHENPAAQWIIPLSGRWFVETMDGHRVEMGPGDASLGEDQDQNRMPLVISDICRGHWATLRSRLCSST